MAEEERVETASKGSPSRDNERHDAEQRAHDQGDSKNGSEDGEASESGIVNGGKVGNATTVDTDAPPLPAEDIPPLPSEAPPTEEQDDGWAPVWEETAQAFYFYNRFTGASQWDNPRVPEAATAAVPPAPGVDVPSLPATTAPPTTSGYNPAIHGDYDPTAWYAQPTAPAAQEGGPAQAGGPQDPAAQYAATAAFNRFTGRFQNAEITPENFNDENKSRRQMNAFFDVDAAANSHDGRSLKAERSGKKLSKTELKQFKEKRKMKKEEKRRAWLRD